MRLDGKKIIVTGGARGIAKAVTMAYVKEGATVAVLDILDELGEQTVKEVNQFGAGKAFYFHCDISKREDVEAVFAQAIDKIGGLDVLANIAGVDRNVKAEETTDELYDFLMNINVRGTVLTNQTAFKVMKEQGFGAIINFGSDTGLVGAPNQAVYGATKAAVMSWTRTVAAEWGQYGIRANSIVPAISTPMAEEYLENMSEAELAEYDAVMKKMIPLGGRLGNPEKDLAPVMIFFASEDSRFITAQTIPVNGGLNAVR